MYVTISEIYIGKRKIQQEKYGRNFSDLLLKVSISMHTKILHFAIRKCSCILQWYSVVMR